MGDEHDVPALDSAVRNGGEDLLPRYGLDGVGLLRSIRFAMERLGCHVIAKGVETSEQACVLAKAGVRLAQG